MFFAIAGISTAAHLCFVLFCLPKKERKKGTREWYSAHSRDEPWFSNCTIDFCSPALLFFQGVRESPSSISAAGPWYFMQVASLSLYRLKFRLFIICWTSWPYYFLKLIYLMLFTIVSISVAYRGTSMHLLVRFCQIAGRAERGLIASLLNSIPTDEWLRDWSGYPAEGYVRLLFRRRLWGQVWRSRNVKPGLQMTDVHKLTAPKSYTLYVMTSF